MDVKIGQIDSGSGFGEIALLENCRRTATVLADECDCDLAILDKEYYLQVLGTEKRYKLISKVKTLAKK